MERRDAVLDASFWINAEEARVLPFLLDYFRLWATPIVVDELTVSMGDANEPAATVVAFAEWLQSGRIQIATPTTTFERFDAGENQAIALAQERGWVLLLDNASPRDCSRGPLHLAVIDSPAFVVFLYDQGRLSYQDAAAALHRTHAGRRMVGEALVALELLARQRGDR